MATYLMFGKFSIDAVKEISAERTKKATAIVEGCGGKIKAVYALLGETDVVAVADFPGLKEAMKASVELTKLLGISFTTVPAVTIEEFDKLIEER
jgi:uncharacterized protein with GYD domain